MIELKHDSLKFSFSEVHPEAQLTIDFQRTLRITHGAGQTKGTPSPNLE
jgi:hypothetical protein